MLQAVSADYLGTLGIPLLRGRMLMAQEINSSQRLAVINEAAVKLWPHGDDPVGRRIRLDELTRPADPAKQTNASPSVTIVGVVGATRNDDLRQRASACDSRSLHSARAAESHARGPKPW